MNQQELPEGPKTELFKIKLADGYELPAIYPQNAEMNLVLDPDPRLREVSTEVILKPNHEDLDEFIAKMAYTMYSCNGIGLAAPQVGTNERIIVFDSDWATAKKLNPMALLNPRIIDVSAEQQSVWEGCLSVGCHYYTNVKRPVEVEVVGTTLSGEEITFVANDLLAAVMCHEVDHLNGKLFIDYLSRLKLDMLKRKKNKLKRRAASIAKRAKLIDLEDQEPQDQEDQTALPAS